MSLKAKCLFCIAFFHLSLASFGGKLIFCWTSLCGKSFEAKCIKYFLEHCDSSALSVLLELVSFPPCLFFSPFLVLSLHVHSFLSTISLSQKGLVTKWGKLLSGFLPWHCTPRSFPNKLWSYGNRGEINRLINCPRLLGSLGKGVFVNNKKSARGGGGYSPNGRSPPLGFYQASHREGVKN